MRVTLCLFKCVTFLWSALLSFHLKSLAHATQRGEGLTYCMKTPCGHWKCSRSLYCFFLFLWLNTAMFKLLKLTMQRSHTSPHTVTMQGRVIKAIWITAVTGPRTHRFADSMLRLWSNCCWGRWKERAASTSGGKSLLDGPKRQEERKQSRGLKTRRTQHFNQTVINTPLPHLKHNRPVGHKVSLLFEYFLTTKRIH